MTKITPFLNPLKNIVWQKLGEIDKLNELDKELEKKASEIEKINVDSLTLAESEARVNEYRKLREQISALIKKRAKLEKEVSVLESRIRDEAKSDSEEKSENEDKDNQKEEVERIIKEAEQEKQETSNYIASLTKEVETKENKQQERKEEPKNPKIPNQKAPEKQSKSQIINYYDWIPKKGEIAFLVILGIIGLWIMKYVIRFLKWIKKLIQTIILETKNLFGINEKKGEIPEKQVAKTPTNEGKTTIREDKEVNEISSEKTDPISEEKKEVEETKKGERTDENRKKKDKGQ